MAGEWVLLVAAEELLGGFGKVLIGLGVSCAVLSGIMGFYLASSRLMYSMSREGYLPKWFSAVDGKYGTPRNAILFCVLISLSGPILGREALGWFVDMSALGASIGYFHLCQHPGHRKEKRRRDRLSEGHGMDRRGVQPDLYGSAADSHSGPVGRSFRKRKLYHAGHLGSDRPCVLL